ncbi:MAG: PQQ-dependent sugar dehydrogenase [Bacteroidetes bacterium]|nr:PQQ-dependent sugar dehydrogenase [Bacteroidota bacterium]
MKKFIPAIFLFFALFTSCKKSGKSSNNLPATVKDTVLVQGLNFPWEVLWGPDDFIWMTQRGGIITRIDPSSGNIIPLLTVSEVNSQNEGGMLGMVLHPDFNSNPFVFVAYDYMQSGSYKGKVVRYEYNNGTLINPITIISNINAATIHNGCRLVITPDMKLFISTGDASNTNDPQNTSVLNGKILRVNLDGTIPSDNPLPGNPVWSFGHRNPQGLVFANNILYSSEHGPDTDDEINIIEKGRNYGWPNVKGFCDPGPEKDFCTANNVREPLKIWTPTIAPSGLDYYNNDAIPQWKNSLLLCTLKDSRLIQLPLNDAHDAIIGANEFYANTYGRLRDLCISPQGNIYFCTSNGGNNDKLVKIFASGNN